MKANVTLVNSDWTGEHVSRVPRRQDAHVVSAGRRSGAAAAVGERRNGFLAVGRISPEKEYERVMTDPRAGPRARARHHADDRRHLDRHARRYSDRCTSLAPSLGSWIDFRDNLTRDEVRALMASHRYGIHGMREEHFGMAPAELVRAGAIVWVPRGGGQMEIVGHEPALMYDTDDDAVEKIVGTLASAVGAAAAARAAGDASEQFSTARFMQQVRDDRERVPG